MSKNIESDVDYTKDATDFEETERGWWELEVTGIVDLSEDSRQHIADMIAQGYTSGEIIQ